MPEPAVPDLRTAARSVFDEMTEVIEERIGPSNGADPIPLQEGEAESLIIDWFRTLRSALAAEATEPPPDEPKPHQAQIVVEWWPSASIGEPAAVKRVLEAICEGAMEALLDLEVTDPTIDLAVDHAR